jgi:DNA-binding FadR family transcriptional regulator
MQLKVGSLGVFKAVTKDLHRGNKMQDDDAGTRKTERNMSNLDIPPLRRRSGHASAELAAHFEKLIASGHLQPGMRIPAERELAVSMSVSRTTLREAMHELEAKHLIERRPGRGTTVLGPSSEVGVLIDTLTDVELQVRHAAEMRFVVEPRIAGFAARRATAADILRLHEVLDQSGDHLRPSESLSLDLQFHALLAEAAQNPLLSAVHRLSADWTGDLRAHSHATKAARQASTEGHRIILAAVIAHDAQAAEDAMEQHLREVADLISQGALRGESKANQTAQPPPMGASEQKP